MADTTPQKQQASARLLQVGVDEESLDGSSYPAGVSRTPGSPTKQGGRTMWTKADDDDVVNGSSAVGASDANGVSETELVIKQVTHTDTLTAPVYGTSAQPTSFKRKGGGLDGRGAGAPSGGRGGGLFGAFMCCIPARKEDRNNQVRLATHRTNDANPRLATMSRTPNCDCRFQATLQHERSFVIFGTKISKRILERRARRTNG